ncbi:hypothetical protein [Saccharopolyspora hattusasensis]|uniref:hypothetical protein n=1 Tax=Saccharopolyspora hattusasensis TaxID=1128679 RepID=UPI003D9627FC
MTALRPGARYPIAHAQAFPSGARLISRPEPVIVDGEASPQQRIDPESGKPVWCLTIVDLALVSQLEPKITVEILADEEPVLPMRREVEFVGLTVEPVQGTGPAGPWTDFVYRALGVTGAPRAIEDTRPLRMELWLGGDKRAGSGKEASR